MYSHASVPRYCCRRNSLAAQKRAQQQGDEWAKIYALHIKEGREKDVAEAAAAAAKADAIKHVLEEQVAFKKQQEMKQHDEEIKYFEQEQVGDCCCCCMVHSVKEALRIETYTLIHRC